MNAQTWVPYFAELLHRPPIEEVLAALRDNGCFNIYAAAYILRVKMSEAGGDPWDGMGRYNSATPALKRAYQQRLVRSYLELYPQAQR